MGSHKYSSTSIVYRLTSLILVIVILQTFLFVAFLIGGGVIDKARNTAYQLFHEKVDNRKDYLQREMKNNWTNFDPYVSNISKLLNPQNSLQDSDAFFDAAVLELIPMLRTTEATGAYIILHGEGNGAPELPALYLRDYDPIMNSYSNDDIYMIYGPPDLAKSLKIPLDQAWRYNFELSEENKDFFVKPHNNAAITSEASLLGYWSKPFTLQQGDVPVVTYSIPLFDSGGILRGVIGIEITLSYLDKQFPANELQPKDSLGYLIGYSEEGKENLTPIVMGGALQRRMISEEQNLELTPVDEGKNIYLINNHNGKEELYAAVEKVGLYQYRTPFEKEQWYLVGIMRGDYLLSDAHSIMKILRISFLLALCLGVTSAILISIQMSRPIVKLARQVNDSNQQKTFRLNPTGLIELDELSRAIELANRRTLESASRLAKIVELLGLPIGAYEINHETGTVFVTHNFSAVIGWKEDSSVTEMNATEFVAMLEETLQAPVPDETDVYEVDPGSSRWVRFKQTAQAGATIGVVLDVTDEILGKKRIMRERDHDPLTLLLNRKGFQSAFDNWKKRRLPTDCAALVMLDLDDLKSINDTYGHKWGDQYIITAVEQLKRMEAQNHAFLGRRSGDEFVLLLHSYERKDEIRACLDCFYHDLKAQQMTFPDGTDKPVGISAGVMWIEGDTFSYDELLHFADEAMYDAKRNHKGTYIENNKV